MTNAKELALGLEDLASQYPKYDLTPEVIRVYVRQLSDLPISAVLAALDEVGKTSTFFPAVAEIRFVVANAAAGPDELAETAWVEVRKEIGEVGWNRPPVSRDGKLTPVRPAQFSSELTRQAVESVGWRHLCMNDEGAVRTEFIFAYRALRKRAVNHIQSGRFSEAASGLISLSGEPRKAVTGEFKSIADMVR